MGGESVERKVEAKRVAKFSNDLAFASPLRRNLGRQIYGMLIGVETLAGVLVGRLPSAPKDTMSH